MMGKAVAVPAMGETPSLSQRCEVFMALKATNELKLFLWALTGRSSKQHTEKRRGGKHAALYLLLCQFSFTLKLATTCTATGTVHRPFPQYTTDICCCAGLGA